MGAFGLSGFGILSCSAKSIHISVPWKNLEKEPTRFEIKGVHLVCVPLTPSTANREYGAGTRIDPRCSLRTRTKRLLLARLERNFWNGQIPGEGPPMKRIQRAVREIERDIKKRRSSTRRSSSRSSEETEFEQAFDNIIYGLNESTNTNSSQHGDEASFSVEDLPEIPRDWKVKLREKVLRNLEASIYDIHIRCEVPEGGLEVRPDGSEVRSHSEESAFVLGFTLESFVMRTANEQWEVGSHDKRNPADGSAMSSATGHLGPNGYVVKNNKIGFFNNFSIYWDKEPPILLADTELLQGNPRRLSPDKLQSRIAVAMEAMFFKQEPGKSVRQALSQPVPR